MYLHAASLEFVGFVYARLIKRRAVIGENCTQLRRTPGSTFLVAIRAGVQQVFKSAGAGQAQEMRCNSICRVRRLR